MTINKSQFEFENGDNASFFRGLKASERQEKWKIFDLRSIT